MHRLLLMLALALVSAGCGLKGPLYLPDSKPAPKPAAKSAPAAKPTSPAPIETDAKEPTP